MFKSKYIFETHSTLTLRRLKILLYLLFVLAVTYVLTCLYLVVNASKLSEQATNGLFNNQPDAIVIFTGDKGRIPHGIKLAMDHSQSQILITGVHNKNTVETLIKPLTLRDGFDPDLLQIDYSARNTVENVIATKNFISGETGLQRVLIVTHDYHIYRSKMIINSLIDRPNTKFFYAGVKSDYTTWRSIKLTIKEVYKISRTILFLMLWEAEI